LGASILRRAVPQGTEFLVITHWASLDSIHAFAGADAQTAVVPPKVQEMMLDFEARARHYEVLPGSQVRAWSRRNSACGLPIMFPSRSR
jgi:heme-degrading monooxygenase HmoA